MRRGVLEVPRRDAAEPLVEQAPVHARRVLVPRPVEVVVAEPDPGCGLDELRDPAGGEEHVRADRAAEEHVVVRVQEVLGEPLDVLQLRLDGLRVEHGQD